MAPKLALITLVVLSVAAMAYADNIPEYGAPSYKQPSYAAPAPSYGAPSYQPPKYADGRVKIQVYRGPNKEASKGYGQQGYGQAYAEESFAPHGYYVTQPEDDKPYKSY